MAGPLTEAEELELLELELEEAQMKARQKSAQPAQPIAKPATGKQAALDARNERIRTSQSLARAAKNQADVERRARVMPVEQKAGRAGIAQLDAMPEANPNAAYSEFMLPPDAQRGLNAEREVYRENDVTSSVDAASIRALNSAAFGVPGIVNKDFRGELAAAGNDQPGASMGGDLVGFLPSSIGLWNTVRAPVNAFARPFTPQGAGSLSRGTRYLAPRAGEVTGGAGLNALFQAAVQEPIRAEQAGEDLTVGGMVEAAKRGLTDPLNLLPLGLSGINRTWNTLTSGIATPSAKAAQVANQFGVGPRQTAASQGIAQTTQQLGGQLQGADIRGLTNIENALRYALKDNPNIPDVNARIADGFQRIRQSLPLEDDPTLNLARLIEREFANDAPQTRDILRRFLLKVGMESPGGEAIVGGAANQIRGQQADVLRGEAESAFGAQPRAEANTAIQGSLDQFSEAYNTVLRGAPTTGPQVDRARALLAREPQTMAILDDVAQSQNLTPEEFLERNPLQALHLVQSELGAQARALAARGDAAAGPLEITVRNMQRPLREGVQGYGELQGLWRQWTQARERMGYVRGAEAGTSGELTEVQGFGDKVLGPGGARNSEMGTQAAADVFLQMDDLSQRAAGLSVRDVIVDELRKMKAAGIDQRYAAPARMAQVATEGGLDALRRVFGEAGERVARRIEQFIDANEFARAIDPQYNSATMNKGQAMATGAQPFAGRMGQTAQGASNALSESAIADSVLMLSGAPPIISAMRAPGIIGKMLQPGQRTQRNIAQTLLRRGEIGSQVPPPPGGPPPITPIDPASVPRGAPPNAFGSTNETAPQRAGGYRSPSSPRPNRLRPYPDSTPESMADHDEKLTNLFGGNPPPPRTPRDVEIERLSQVERDALAELDELDKRVVDMGVDPAILEDRRILPSDVSPNAWPQVQEIMAQMDDAATRLMRARDEVASLRNAPDGDGFGSPLPPNPPRTMGQGLGAGLRGDLGNMAGGALGGGLIPLPSTGDPKKDMQQRLALMGTMAVAAGGGPRLVNAFARQAPRVGKVAGQGMPKTPAQAARFETPGSPEWEAAKAKGLDMSQAGRMARAKEQGFDTDTVLYHGTKNDIEAFRRGAGGDLGPGVYFSTETGVPTLYAQGDGANILPVYARGRLANSQQFSDAVRAAEQGGARGHDAYIEAVAALERAGFDGIRDGGVVSIFDPANIRSVNAAFDPDKAASPILTAGIGGGGRGPRKPLAAPKMDKQAKAIEDGVRKIVQKQKANNQTGMKIEKPEGRLSKGLSKLSGVMDDPVKAEAQASAMHHAGRSADEIWDATKNIVVKIDGRTLLKRGPYPTQEENIGAFWQAMALPASKRPDWVRRGTKEIFPKGPDAIAQKPFKDRAEYAAKRFSGSAADDASIVNGELLWEETGVVAVLKSKNGQPMTMTKGSAVGSKAVAMLDGKQFRSWKEAMDWLKSVAALPRNKQPKWYTDNFSEVLDAKTLRKPTSLEIAPTKARELIRKHPIASRGVALATGGTLGATGVALIANSTDRRQPKNAMAK